MNLDNIKFCPFCDDSPIIRTRAGCVGDIYVDVGCDNCNIFFSDSVENNSSFLELEQAAKTAIERWNRRAGE